MSYFDHPPFVSYLYAIGSIFENWGQAVRWPGIVMSQASIWIWLQILARSFSEKKLFAFALLMNAWPLFGLAAIVVTPDTPLLFFWSASIWFFLRVLEKGRAQDYLLLGICLGLGGLSKYQIVLLLPCFLLFLMSTGKWRQLEGRKVLLSFFSGALVCSPVFIWNATHNWDSFLFQYRHGLDRGPWQAEWTWSYIGGQFLILSPPLIYFALRRREKNFLDRNLLVLLAGFPLLFFLITSFRGFVEANWPIMTYPAVAGLAIGASPDLRWTKWLAAFWLSISLIAVTNVNIYWLPIDLAKKRLSEHKPFAVYQKLAQSYQPLYADRFQTASYLSWLTKMDVCKLRDYGRRDFFDYLDCSIPQSQRYYFFVPQGSVQLPPWAQQHRISARIPVDQNYQILEIERP